MNKLSVKASRALREIADGRDWTYRVADGEVRVVTTSLPGRHVLSVCRAGDTLWVIVDPTKPDSRAHLSELMDNWPLDIDNPNQPHVTLGGVIDLLQPFTGVTEPVARSIIRDEALH